MLIVSRIIAWGLTYFQGKMARIMKISDHRNLELAIWYIIIIISLRSTYLHLEARSIGRSFLIDLAFQQTKY